MGEVFEAYDRERQEQVALKTIQSAGGRPLARFKREFRALHDLSHPNLVALGELFDDGSRPFFSMELISGTDFLTYVRGLEDVAEPRRDAPATPREVEPIPFDEVRLRAALRQLALGIAALHDAGMVHRDIKPSNVLVTREGRVVLLDFGLVAETTSATAATLSSNADAVGTVAYMAPEQAISGNVGPAADWYSLGVLLFESLTGALPHTGRTPFDIILNKQQFMAAPPRQFVPTVPPDLDALCSGLLQIEVGDRLCGRDVFDRLGIQEGPGLPLEGLEASRSVTARVPFVGRTEELRKLRLAYEQSRKSPLIFLVEGVSGVGKTQLVEVFIEQLGETDPDAVVLTGRCYEREAVSYKAFDGIAEALARHLAHLPPVEVAALMPLQAALLARLFPVLRRVEQIAAAPREDDLPDPHDQRRRMFAALRELFLRMADRRPLVCFIDDLQWTDADSLILLQDLLAGEDPLPILLIATLRPVDDDMRRSVADRIEALAPTQRLLLEELSLEESTTLAGLLLPEKDTSVHHTVAADAGGHPLFLQALARHLRASKGVAATGTSLEEMLAARIDGLNSKAKTLLQVVSVYGGPVTQEIAALAAEMSHGEQAKAARVLRAAHLVRTDGVRRTDRIVPYHDRVREHVTSGLDPERRVYLHERLAVALAQTDAAEHDPRALVRHARAAGRHTLAATHALAAAEHAVAALAFDQAAEFFAAAIELHNHDDATLRSLRLQLASALVHAGRGPEAAEILMLAAEGAEPAVRLDCQRQAAEQWINTGHLNKGMEALRASLADIGEPLAASPRGALIRVVWNRMRLRLRGMGYRRRLESQVTVESLRRLDVLRTVAHGLAMVDYIRGADFNGRFLLLALRTGEPVRLIEAMATEVVYLTSQGGRAARRGRRLLGRMAELTESTPDDAYARSWQLMADGSASYFEGRFAAADETLEKCETVLSTETTGTTAERNNARVFRVLSLRLMGRWRRSRALATESLRSGQQRGDRYLETTIRLLRVQNLIARDDLAEARASQDAALWSPREAGYPTHSYFQYNARAELALYEGTTPDSLAQLAQAFAVLNGSMLVRVALVRTMACGLHGRLSLAAAASRTDPDDARAEAAAMARRLGREELGCAQVFALLLRAGLAALAGAPDSDETVTLLRRAIDRAVENDMFLHAASARDRLGIILGGDEGEALRAEAASYAAQEGIVRPEQLFAAVTPGLGT